MTRWLLNKSMDFVLHRPKLASACVNLLKPFPAINQKLISFASDEGLITHDHGPVPKKPKKGGKKPSSIEPFSGPVRTETSPLKAAIKLKGKNENEKSPLEKWFY